MECPQIFTTGHSTLSLDAFLSALQANVVSVVADVRSAPYSRFNSPFFFWHRPPSALENRLEDAVVARRVEVLGRIRSKTGLSQPAFARSIVIPLGTLKNWEQGRRRPEGPARVLLALIDKRPAIVQEELGR